MKLIDIHSHFLPGIDDGAKDVLQSTKMLSESYRQGVTLCVATPHAMLHGKNSAEKFVGRREKSFNHLKKELDFKKCEVPKILLGAEVFLDNDVTVYDGISKLCIEGTNLLLVEFAVSKKFNERIWDWIYALNYKDIVPVIAHVDRYPFWERILTDFDGLNVKFQINAAKFLSFSGRNLIRKIMRYNYDYIVSSDMHNMTGRKCNMSDAYRKAVKMFKDDAVKLFETNAGNALKINDAHKVVL